MEEHSYFEQRHNLERLVLWTDLTLWGKIKLFSIWSVLSIVSGILQLFGSLQHIIDVFAVFETDEGIAGSAPGNGVEVMIGLGCMAAWLGLIRYMETSDNYSILAKTLSFAMPNVIKTLISALPVLMGYTFLGLALFW